LMDQAVNGKPLVLFPQLDRARVAIEVRSNLFPTVQLERRGSDLALRMRIP
jgi:hypothetical protein